MRRRGTIALFLTAAIAVAATPAHAGTYNVVACADAQGAVNNSWTVSNNAPSKLETGNGCGGSGNYAGLYARDVLDVSNAPSQGSAQWTFTAPVGTSISALSYSRWFYKEDDDDWRPALTADGTVVDTCAIVYPAVNCNSGVQGGERTTTTFVGVASLSVGVLCTAPTNSTCVNGAVGQHAVDAVLYGATVTLSDSSAPTVSNVGGPLLAGGYQKGSQFASFDASDNAGIRTGRLYVDGGLAASSTYSCNFTFAVPCANKSGGELVLDTASLADGTHSVQLAGVDPAANEQKSSARSITVDNGAPTSPEALAVDGGAGWHASNSFAVSWTNPGGQVAPIAVAHYQVCAGNGSSCQPAQQVAAQGVSRIDGISVPSTGEWQLRVWLEDGAGNVDSGQVATATLRYGSAPVQPQPSPDPTPSPSPSPDPAPAPAPAPDGTPTAPTPAPSVTRHDPHLRLTSAKLSRGRVIVRGRTAAGARARLTLTLRLPGGRKVVHTATVRGGAFTITFRVARVSRLRGSLLGRFAGSASYRPARVSLRLR